MAGIMARDDYIIRMERLNIMVVSKKACFTGRGCFIPMQEFFLMKDIF